MLRLRQQMQPHLTPEMNVLELAWRVRRGSGLPAFPPGAGLGGYGFFAQNDRRGKAETPRGGGLRFSVEDATSLPYADETFDAVLIANALHIMPRPEKALAEIYRVLKFPGGQLFAQPLCMARHPAPGCACLPCGARGCKSITAGWCRNTWHFCRRAASAVQEHALLGDTLAPPRHARAVPDKTRVTQR